MADSLIEDDKADEEPESGRRMDPELRTMAQMMRLMSGLDDEPAKVRVMAYLSSRWQAAKES
jgi:hypothetical protein